MCKIWVKKVYNNFQCIVSDKNPLVTCADFDHISSIFGDVMANNIMQSIEHIKFDEYSKDQNSLP